MTVEYMGNRPIITLADGLEVVSFSDERLHIRSGCDPQCPIALDRKERGTKLIHKLNEGSIVLDSGVKVLPVSLIDEGGELHDVYAQYEETWDAVQPIVCMESEAILGSRGKVGVYCASAEQEIYFDGGTE